MTIRFRPLADWPRLPTTARRGIRWSGKASYATIITRLQTELEQLQASSVWIESGHDADDLRLDGHLRETAKDPRFPGVIVRLFADVTFGVPGSEATPLGPLWFACGTFDEWQDNLYAIAMTMERVRTITSYGTVSETAVYALFADTSPLASQRDPGAPRQEGRGKRARSSREKAKTDSRKSTNTPPPFTQPTMSTEATRLHAARLLLREAGEPDDVELAHFLLQDTSIAKRVFIVAAKRAHPDLGGTNERMRTVYDAWATLGGN